MKQLHLLAGLVLCVLFGRPILAQVAVPFKSATDDTIRTVYIWHADTLREASKDTLTKVQSLFGHVKLQEEKTFFYCDSVAINQSENIVEAFGNVHINDADSTNIYSQYMRYFVDKRYIIFQKNVSLINGKGVLTTDELHYDMNLKIGTYINGGKVVNGSTVITSHDGVYYEETRDVYFKNNVLLVDPKYTLKTDSLLYNTQSQIATFITQTHIRDSSGRTIDTKDGYYDLANHRAQFGKRPTITDGSQKVIGDEVHFDDSTGLSRAVGHAVFVDSSQHIAILAGRLESNRKANTLLAVENPLMIIQQDKDSFYITADTLFSGQLPDSVIAKGRLITKDSNDRTISYRVPVDVKNDSSNRYFQGYHHVRIFSDSIQAVADSLFYSGIDSVFQLFTNPIAWANGSQVTGDTMYLYTKNKKPDRLYVFFDGLVVSKAGENMYSQVKGNTLNGFFKDGSIDHLRAKGSAESIYYIRDDAQALVGVNKVNKADIIDMIFADRELNKVILRNDADGIMYPIRKVNLDDMRLRNFKWLEAKRPKSKYELFGQ